ncbi:hypothetical protein P280DRAFT_536529 [Massarina eburnea CBS 473.64]|uniref:Uncharacterized protein n=1 Tax=Massarina eburnea CBS 473.64 TaxID=1395130 RepID=A0A6A6RJF7_9PLEO|nr:hypothetical protein P280DRAFT_536529 [Massarina eburnea CBS 473.64]
MNDRTDPRYLIAPIYHIYTKIFYDANNKYTELSNIHAEDAPTNPSPSQFHAGLQERWKAWWKAHETKDPHHPSMVYHNIFRTQPIYAPARESKKRNYVKSCVKTLQDDAKERGARVPSAKEAAAMVDLMEFVEYAARRAANKWTNAKEFYVLTSFDGTLYEAAMFVVGQDKPIAKAKGRNHRNAVGELGEMLQV